MKKDKVLIRFRKCSVGWNHVGKGCEWEALHDDDMGVIMAVGGYSRRADAKRGMIRFLKRMGADLDRIEWEDAR